MRSPPEPEVFLTLVEVAERLHKHPKTLRRMLPELMARNPNLRARKLGRSLMFTERDFDQLTEAIAWRPVAAGPAAHDVGASRQKMSRGAALTPAAERDHSVAYMRAKREARMLARQAKRRS